MNSKNDHYDLFAEMDSHMTRPRFRPQRSNHFYPSEASVVTTDGHGDNVVMGKCMRAAFFRLSHEFEGRSHDARTEYIFLQGKRVEESLVEIWKQMGVWVDNNIKFLDEENGISGELDAILVEPSGQLYGVEVKSFYGYNAEKEILGNKYHKGFPKMDHLLQTLVYLNFFQRDLPYFRIVYFDRGGAQRTTFKVELHQEGNIVYPKIDGEIIRTFTIGDILARYRELKQHVDSNTVPPNDFELQYSDESIEDFFQKGKVGKTKYEKWKKNKLAPYEYIGDWQCSYCQYKETCWSNIRNR
jgi:hypothetical protein